jgi:site-specific DNA-methyltransferase (cytosine-N4-specific)
MKDLLRNGYKAMKRPSGHDISDRFSTNNGASIPPNLLAVANTESNGYYLRYCKERGLEPHPARFPTSIPEYFVRMLTDPGELVVDPFAGSCVTGEVCERLERKWVCIELIEDYLKGALGRFKKPKTTTQYSLLVPQPEPSDYYKVPRPGILWNGQPGRPLSPEGGRLRRAHLSPLATRQ